MKILSLSKKKAVFVSILALCMCLSIFNVAFAADDPEPNEKITTDTLETITIHGYVGPFAEVVIPDPVEIYVEVPVKILFAAFDTDEGEVTSPNYKIINLSDTNDVKVEIEGFVQQDDPIAILDNQLSLKLLTPDNEDLVSELFPADYSSAKLVKDNLSKNIEGYNDNIIEFMIGGTWSGSFETEIKPVFDMTVKFTGIE